jgi:hypothetical protein
MIYFSLFATVALAIKPLDEYVNKYDPNYGWYEVQD